ncbi:SH2 domain-containing protein 4A [Conger conger]|uniref:SH2 domain-containing protein 4A n=1 Tax=Conger conger TaxID=82655 RepID=UPI002A5A2373|nr:SH2 domain-containing protein 4A [Conger conger]
MLQQILKDMYIDPDVLEALNEEQKKILFLKMRQEQVRRWKESEDKLDREGRAKPKLTKAHRKSVSWLLGRDGDVQAYVIGEADEVGPAPLIYSELGKEKGPGLQNNTRHQSNAIRSSLVTNRPSPEPENVPSQTPRVQLQSNGVPPASGSMQKPPQPQNSEDVKSESHSPPLQVPRSEQPSPSPAAPEKKEKEKEEEEDSVPDSLQDSGLYYRSHLSRGPAPSITDRLRPVESLRADLQSSVDRLRQQAREAEQEGAEPTGALSDGELSLSRGRVAQLLKTFGTPIPRQNTLSRRKPPLPNKPTHLLFASSSPR